MRYVAWSSTARRDLEDIYNFYLPKNPAVAAQIHDSIIDETERLARWPEIGRREEFINNKKYKSIFRSLITSNGLYKIIYTFSDEYIAIARIWSCRKDPTTISL